MGAIARTLPELGTVLAGKYAIIRRIGEGGMGVVYEAEHLRLKQRVAIKMLLPEVMELPDVVSRFEREARAAGQLRSTNTARILDVESSEHGVPYMVMEFLDGHDLSTEIEQRGPLPVGEAVEYVLQACNAMREAHQHGIVHRDLKPSNLFLTSVEGHPVVKVLDFGISKLENEHEARVTGTQTTVGTPLYMSPEQIRSAKYVDSRTDIWSLGIIMFELLTGKTPFEGSTTAAAVAICVDALPSLRGCRPDVPPELDAVVMRALAKDRDARFPDIEAFATALVPFAPGSTSFVPCASPSGTLRAAPSHPSLGAFARTEASGADLLASLGGGRPGAATSGTWSSRAHRPRRTLTIVAAFGGVLAVGGLVAAGLAWRANAGHVDPRPSAAPIAPLVPVAKPTASTTTDLGAATAPTRAPATTPASTAAPTHTTRPVKPPPPSTGRPPPTGTGTTTAPTSTGTGWGPAHL